MEISYKSRGGIYQMMRICVTAVSYTEIIHYEREDGWPCDVPPQSGRSRAWHISVFFHVQFQITSLYNVIIRFRTYITECYHDNIIKTIHLLFKRACYNILEYDSASFMDRSYKYI